MATRSCIAVKLADGSFRGVYCHSDGYPSWVGRYLNDYFNSQEDAEALTALGHLSQLGVNLNETISYHKWRDEPIAFATGPDIASVRNKIDCQYAYLFADGKWSVAQWLYNANRFSVAKPVTRYRDAKGNWHDEARRA